MSMRETLLGAALLATAVSAAATPEKEILVSVYQGICREGDFAANLSAVRKITEEARKRGSHFLCFPECFLSGYESPEAVAAGARPLDAPVLQAFIRETAAHEMVVLVGLARKAPDGLYNTVLVIQHGRLLGLYDKVLLTGGDSGALGFKPGTSVPVFFAHGVRFAVQICHDSSFPHIALAAKLQGAQLLFSPHNNEIGASAADEHRRWVRNCHVGLACQMKMVVARANNVKSDRPGQIGYGDSFILSPQGAPLAEAGLFREALITAAIPPAMFRAPSPWADFSETPAWLRSQVADLLTAFRKPTTDADLASWLENMVVYHRFTPEEVSAATGLTQQEVHEALRRSGLEGRNPEPRKPGAPLRALPYPGGRHPRIGFLEGALMPQRETKVSIFTPWEEGGYVVADVPEALFSNRGLIYLAHSHIPTLWDQQGIRLPRQEWDRRPDGTLEMERTLPDGIVFGARVTPTGSDVRFELWLRNGTKETLTNLRVQNCVMLARAVGFEAQADDNKVYQPPFAAARSGDGRRWILTAWDPCDRCWGNLQCPCIHSDPRFPDCPPGATVRARGRLWFYEGTDIEAEFRRLEKAGWK